MQTKEKETLELLDEVCRWWYEVDVDPHYYDEERHWFEQQEKGEKLFARINDHLGTINRDRKIYARIRPF